MYSAPTRRITLEFNDLVASNAARELAAIHLSCVDVSTDSIDRLKVTCTTVDRLLPETDKHIPTADIKRASVSISLPDQFADTYGLAGVMRLAPVICINM